jgi:hypothetical protein
LYVYQSFRLRHCSSFMIVFGSIHLFNNLEIGIVNNILPISKVASKNFQELILNSCYYSYLFVRYFLLVIINIIFGNVIYWFLVFEI